MLILSIDAARYSVPIKCTALYHISHCCQYIIDTAIYVSFISLPQYDHYHLMQRAGIQ